MSRIAEHKYCLISASCVTGVFDISILLPILQKIKCVLVNFYR